MIRRFIFTLNNKWTRPRDIILQTSKGTYWTYAKIGVQEAVAHGEIALTHAFLQRISQTASGVWRRLDEHKLLKITHPLQDHTVLRGGTYNVAWKEPTQ